MEYLKAYIGRVTLDKDDRVIGSTPETGGLRHVEDSAGKRIGITSWADVRRAQRDGRGVPVLGLPRESGQ